jgi:uncharacterized protein (UPF0333 family)
MARTKKTKGVEVTNKNVGKVIEDAKKAIENSFEFVVSVCGQKLTVNTDNLAETILTIKPKKVTGKVIIEVTHNGKKVTRIMHPFQARKLFNNKLMAEFFAKNTMLQLK